MQPREIIRVKRCKNSLSAAQIEEFIAGVVSGRWSDAQIASLSMAICAYGMTLAEAVLLTNAMRTSGQTLQWLNCNGPVVDKHSTGGVGDTVSLMLAPMLAACGVFVPMIAGKGLGHTGGTIDKLSAIPGYDAQPSMSAFQHIVMQVGCAIIGQTEELAPADKRLYAIRDATDTIESPFLIAASILSKKLAAGVSTLALDIKVGNGAFCTDMLSARQLADVITAICTQCNCVPAVIFSDMSQPLGRTVGNALEVAAAVAYLTGQTRDTRLHSVTMAVGAILLARADICDSVDEGRELLQRRLDDGAACEHFSQMVAALGGPSDFVSRVDSYLPRAPVILPVYATEAGIVQQCDTYRLGLSLVDLGGGRAHPHDSIDAAVGLTSVCAIGDVTDTEVPLAVIHAPSDALAMRAAARVREAFVIGERVVSPPPLVLDR